MAFDEKISKYPLEWPFGRTRSKTVQRAAFTRNRTFAEARDAVLHELCLLGVHADEIVISSNLKLRLDGLPTAAQGEPYDKGIAVYFRLKRTGMPLCLCCDRYDRCADNMWAIAKWIEAERSQLRHGVGSLEEAFRGFLALPAPDGWKPWHEVLRVPKTATRDQIDAAFTSRAKECHPDMPGGSHDAMTRLNQAREEALRERAR